MAGNDLVAIARSPEELQEAQKKLIEWTDTKRDLAQADLDDLEANLAHAKKNKWRT